MLLHISISVQQYGPKLTFKARSKLCRNASYNGIYSPISSRTTSCIFHQTPISNGFFAFTASALDRSPMLDAKGKFLISLLLSGDGWHQMRCHYEAVLGCHDVYGGTCTCIRLELSALCFRLYTLLALSINSSCTRYGVVLGDCNDTNALLKFLQ